MWKVMHPQFGVLSHDLTAADNQIVASFTHTDVNNCIIRKEKNCFSQSRKTDFSEAEACAIDDTGKDYQEYVIRISYDKAYDAVKENIFLQIDFPGRSGRTLSEWRENCGSVFHW